MTSRIRTIIGWFKPNRLTGPIFTKELRVTSRQKRHYLLRFAYIMLLSLFVLLAWLSAVDYDSTGSSMYRMSDAGKTIIMTITWFQFVSLQLIAIVLMSTSVSEEIYRGTMAAMLTTPITRTQIIVGKLLSKMVQLGILLLISLPLLSVVRIFGGVPWNYIIAANCVTLTAAMFTGAVAMFYSILFRRAYSSILLTLATGLVLYMILPLILGLIFLLATLASSGPPELAMMVMLYVNPSSALGVCTMSMYSPGSMAAGRMSFYWPIHCLVMLGLTAGVLTPCIFMVRRVSLRRAFGKAANYPLPLPPTLASRPAVSPPTPPALPPATQPAPSAGQAATPPPMPPPMPPPVVVVVPAATDTMTGVRRITGSPLLWKQLHTGKRLSGKTVRIVFGCIAMALILLLYILMGSLDFLKESGTQAFFIIMYLLVGMFSTSVNAATTISTEKETRSLPILMATPLSDWHIIITFAAGILRRTWMAWLLLLAHILVFTIVGYLKPILLLHMLLLIVWLNVFMIGSGLYFSSCYKKTTAAVISNMGFGLAIWLIIPILAGILGMGESIIVNANPVMQAAIVTVGAEGDGNGFYDWAGGNYDDTETAAKTTLFMFLWLLGYSAAGFLLLWRAKVRLRRKLF
ncbi:MAG: ABC transporter permease [Phycisphaerae bacterium]|nr:ABC transporter permease [Phycisphaerae bacterium]